MYWHGGFVMNVDKEKLTSEPVMAGNCSNALPEFGRVQDVQRLFGVKRGILYRWIQERRIKSVLMREKGNIIAAQSIGEPGTQLPINTLLHR